MLRSHCQNVGSKICVSENAIINFAFPWKAQWLGTITTIWVLRSLDGGMLRKKCVFFENSMVWNHDTKLSVVTPVWENAIKNLALPWTQPWFGNITTFGCCDPCMGKHYQNLSISLKHSMVWSHYRNVDLTMPVWDNTIRKRSSLKSYGLEPLPKCGFCNACMETYNKNCAVFWRTP